MAEIASAFVSLIPSFKGGQAAISKELSGAGAAAGGRAGKVTGGAMSAGILGSLKGIAGPLAAVFAGVQVKDFLTDAITGASDLGETLSKNRQIFGGSAAGIAAFAKNANTNLGQTRQQALDGAATFGVFGKAAGLSGKNLAGFSTEMVSLSADLASFHNATPEEAIEAIGAALRGEAEPMRRFGVLLDDASLRQEALRQGLVKTTKDALTPQQKTLAAHALIMRQTKDAQGDFGRTSDGLANQQRILAAQWEDTKTTLGAGLLPIVTSVVSKFNDWLPGIQQIGRQVGAVLGPALSQAGDLISGLVGALSGGAGGGLLPILGQIGRQIIAVAGPALRQIGQIITTQVAPAFRAFLTAVAPIAAFLLRLFGSAIVGALKGVVNVVKGVLTVLSGVFNVFAGIFTGDWSKVWKGIKQIASGIWKAIKGAFQVFVNVGLGRVFKLGGALLAKIGKGIWSALSKLFSAGAKAVGRIVSRGVSAVVKFFAALPGKALGVLRSLAGRLGRLFTSAFTRARSAVTSGISRILTTLRGIPGRAVSAVGNLGRTLYRAGASLIGGLINGITEKIGQLKSKLSEVTGLIPDWKGPASRDAELLRDNGRLILGGLIAGIDDRVPALASTLGGITGRVPGMLGTPDLTGPGAAGPPQIRVYIGERELTDIVRVEVGETNRATRRRVLSGVGASW